MRGDVMEKGGVGRRGTTTCTTKEHRRKTAVLLLYIMCSFQVGLFNLPALP